MIIKKSDDYKVLVKALENESICLVPTETVYGVCCIYDSKLAHDKLLELKQRPVEKNFPLAFGSHKMIEDLCELSSFQKKCVERLLPGPITLILKSNKIDERLLKNGTVAVRYSNDEYLNRVINELRKPILLTSANLSGKEPFKNVFDAYNTFKDDVEVYVDDKLIDGVPSTIIDISNDQLVVLRKGPISEDEIKKILEV